MHISNETYINLTGEYNVKDGNGGDRDKFLKEKNVVTFLITPKTETDDHEYTHSM